MQNERRQLSHISSRTRLFGLLLSAAFVAGCTKHEKDYAVANTVSVQYGKKTTSAGLTYIPATDGIQLKSTTVEGTDCAVLRLRRDQLAYLHFSIDQSFKANGISNALVEVEYFDATKGHFDLCYDGKAGHYTPARLHVTQERSLAWETAVFSLKDAKFRNSQKSRADFRIRVQAPEFFIRKVTVLRDPDPPEDTSRFASEVSITLGATNLESGLTQTFDYLDGETSAATIGGFQCRRLRPVPRTHVYFFVDPEFKRTVPMDVRLTLDYFDDQVGEIFVQYDGPSSPDPKKAAYTVSPSHELTKKTGQWRRAEFALPHARFRNSQNGEADFRIIATQAGLHIRRVQLERIQL